MNSNKTTDIKLAATSQKAATAFFVGTCTAILVAAISYLIAALGLVNDPELARALGPALGIFLGIGTAIYWAFAGPQTVGIFGKSRPRIERLLTRISSLGGRLRQSAVMGVFFVLVMALGALGSTNRLLGGALMGMAIVEAWRVYKLIRSRRQTKN